MARIDDKIAAVAAASKALDNATYGTDEWESCKRAYHDLRNGIRRRYAELRGGIRRVEGSLYTGLHSRIAIGRGPDYWQVRYLRSDGTCSFVGPFGNYRSRVEAAREIDSMINGGSRYQY